jgi:spore coat protein CotF
MTRSRKVGTARMKSRFSARAYCLALLIAGLIVGSTGYQSRIRAFDCPSSVVVTTNADSGAGSLRQAIADVCDGGAITFADSVVSPITLTSGGLVLIRKGVTIQGPGTRPMTISGNHAYRVIEMRFDSGNPVTLSDLTIADGRVDLDVLAAGVYNNGGGTLNIINCTITGNVNFGSPAAPAPGFGGGIGNNGTMNIVNSTISGNSATGRTAGGGGIFNGPGNGGGTLNLTNCTISGNSSDDRGGGIRNNGGTVNIQNTIVAGNTASQPGPDIFNPFNSLGNNLIGKSDGGSGFTNGMNNDKVGTVAMPLDPKLGPLQDNGGPTFTMALLTGSPALDAGSDSVLGTPLFLTTDQRGTGFPRKTGAHVDIGAFELTAPTIDCGAVTAQSAFADTSCQATVPDVRELVRMHSTDRTTMRADLTITQDPTQGATVSGAGSHPITVTVTNAANLSATCIVGFTVSDNISPVIANCGQIAAQTANTNASCQATVPDVRALVRAQSSDNCTMQAALVVTQNPMQGSLVTGPGSHPITVMVADASNNSTTCVVAFTVVQTTAPAITCGSVPAQSANTNASCQATVPDVRALVRAQSSDTCTPQASLTVTQSPLQGTTVSGAGSHPITVTVTNGANISATCMVGFTVIDNISPVFTSCPGNMIVQAPPGAMTVIVNYPTPTATDNCSVPSVICNPPSGSAFPVGAVTTVTCTATDASGNKATCSFTVSAFNVCIQDDVTGDNLRFNSVTGSYIYTRCRDKFTLSGTGTARLAGGMLSLTDSRSDRKITAGLNTAQLTGRANITLILAPGIYQTITLNQTNPHATCTCP